MSEREKEDKGGEEEAGTEKHKNAEDLGRELLRAAKECGESEGAATVRGRGCALSR